MAVGYVWDDANMQIRFQTILQINSLRLKIYIYFWEAKEVISYKEFQEFIYESFRHGFGLSTLMNILKSINSTLM